MNKNKILLQNPQKSHVKLGDKIKVICGNQKGLIGTISSIVRTKSVATITEILPRIKYKGKEGDKKELPLYIHLSNLMLWDTNKNVASKIGYKMINEKKYRYFKKTGNIVEQSEKSDKK
jgi:large subunit ribosomal protein L24